MPAVRRVKRMCRPFSWTSARGSGRASAGIRPAAAAAAPGLRPARPAGSAGLSTCQRSMSFSSSARGGRAHERAVFSSLLLRVRSCLSWRRLGASSAAAPGPWPSRPCPRRTVGDLLQARVGNLRARRERRRGRAGAGAGAGAGGAGAGPPRLPAWPARAGGAGRTRERRISRTASNAKLFIPVILSYAMTKLVILSNR